MVLHMWQTINKRLAISTNKVYNLINSVLLNIDPKTKLGSNKLVLSPQLSCVDVFTFNLR